MQHNNYRSENVLADRAEEGEALLGAARSPGARARSRDNLGVARGESRAVTPTIEEEPDPGESDKLL